MNKLLNETTNWSDGIQAKIWETISGKYMVSYHDLDSGKQLQTFTICETLSQAVNKAQAFAFGVYGSATINA